jgi:hypothetical protein
MVKFSAPYVKIVSEHLSDIINLRVFRIPKEESKSLMIYSSGMEKTNN